MRRLYLQIYLCFVGILLLFATLVTATWVLRDTGDNHQEDFDKLGALASRFLPAADRPADELREALADLHRQFEVDLLVSDRRGVPIASAGLMCPPDPPPAKRKVRVITEERTQVPFSLRKRNLGPSFACPSPPADPRRTP